MKTIRGKLVFLLTSLVLYLLGASSVSLAAAMADTGQIDEASNKPATALYLPFVLAEHTGASHGVDGQDVPAVVAAVYPAPPTLSTLAPGGFREIDQNLPINIVFVGFEPGAGVRNLNESIFRGGLPTGARSLIRNPELNYGLKEYIGLSFHYNYQLLYTPLAFENAFFGYLASIAVAHPLTIDQTLYNQQTARSLNVTTNYWIDAPRVERWLADHAGPLLGVDTHQYTIFFINWYGRADFRFHVYTKTDEPDPDTGYNFGLFKDRTKLMAWGGTTPDDPQNGLGSLHRIWFYDQSAGPEAVTDNWNLSDTDVDGDEVLDYRLPPVWEYGNTQGYRPFTDLSGDLAKVTRYAAIDSFVTASPAYQPATSPPGLADAIQLEINLYQADPGVDGSAYFKPDMIVNAVSALRPLNSFSLEFNRLPFTGRITEIYQCYYSGVSCYPGRLGGQPYYDLLLYFTGHLGQYLEGDADFELPIFAFNTTDALDPGYLGTNEDNSVNGEQQFVYLFDSPGARSAGYGFTTTAIHEIGHYLGLSHPLDGYDYESDVNFDATGAFYFVGAGNETNSIMSYVDLNWDFGQFDRDNMNRYLTAVYINYANRILAQVYAKPHAADATNLLLAADAQAAQALTAYAGMDYSGATLAARQAYQTVLAAATQLQVRIEPHSWRSDFRIKPRNKRFADLMNFQRSKP